MSGGTCWSLPLSIGLSMIYKAMRVGNLDRFWREVVTMTLQIILGLVGPRHRPAGAGAGPAAGVARRIITLPSSGNICRCPIADFARAKGKLARCDPARRSE